GTIVGIIETSTASTTYQAPFVSGNTIYALNNNNGSTSTASQITGLYWSGTTGGLYALISKNLIYNIGMTAASTTVAPVLIGMDCGTAGLGTFQNNMIRMGYDAAGSAYPAAMEVRGITKGGSTANIWFNSVYVGGTGVGSQTNNSYGLK